MGYVLVAMIAKLLGRDPQETWESFAKWAIRALLSFVAFVLLYALLAWAWKAVT